MNNMHLPRISTPRTRPKIACTVDMQKTTAGRPACNVEIHAGAAAAGMHPSPDPGPSHGVAEDPVRPLRYPTAGWRLHVHADAVHKARACTCTRRCLQLSSRPGSGGRECPRRWRVGIARAFCG